MAIWFEGDHRRKSDIIAWRYAIRVFEYLIVFNAYIKPEMTVLSYTVRPMLILVEPNTRAARTYGSAVPLCISFVYAAAGMHINISRNEKVHAGHDNVRPGNGWF